MRQKMTSAYHQQTNFTERVNWTLKTMIASYAAENHKHWDKYLLDFRFALNSAVHETIDHSCRVWVELLEAPWM